MRGADISSLQRGLEVGAEYYTAAGVAADPLNILNAAGVNYVRLRVWNNPVSGYNNASKVLAYAKTVRAKGFKLLVDSHYSDTWADPGVQTKPAAWSSHGISTLQTDVYPGNGWNPANIATSGDRWDNMAVFNWTGVFTRSDPAPEWRVLSALGPPSRQRRQGARPARSGRFSAWLPKDQLERKSPDRSG